MTPSLSPSRRSVSASAPSKRPDAAEPRDQRLGLRLGVAARDCERQQIFDQFMIKQRLAAAIEQALAKAGTVAGGVAGGVGSSAMASQC